MAALAGCGSHRAAPDAPAVALTCGSAQGASVRAVWLGASDGQRLYALHGGTGDTGVVFVPESPPGNVCDWLPSLAAFERAGLRVLALDYRGTGNSTLGDGMADFAYGRDLAAAVSQLRDDGAKSVVVLGASLGGAAAMAYAPRLDVDAVVSLSGEPALPARTIDAARAMSQLHVPLLIVGTRHDAYLPVAAARQLIRRAGTNDKRAVFYPGSWHGWDIVQRAPFATRARALVISWIRRRSR